MSTATPFLMFQGQAQAAIDRYVAVLPNTQVLHMARHDGAGTGEGSVKLARVAICGNTFLFSDSPPVHAFSFTPSCSVFIDCDSREQQQRIFRRFEQADGVNTQIRFGGSGLGLAISRDLAALMDGALTVTSLP